MQRKRFHTITHTKKKKQGFWSVSIAMNWLCSRNTYFAMVRSDWLLSLSMRNIRLAVIGCNTEAEASGSVRILKLCRNSVIKNWWWISGFSWAWSSHKAFRVGAQYHFLLWLRLVCLGYRCSWHTCYLSLWRCHIIDTLVLKGGTHCSEAQQSCFCILTLFFPIFIHSSHLEIVV